MTTRYDVAVIGGGFGGTLLGICLAAQGRRVVVFERDRHPRFAIGESTTPLANWALRDLCDRYGLDELRALTRYGSWKETHPELGVGPKRGFGFFHHARGEPFAPRPDRSNELLVAANPSLAQADTQWLRADIDAFFADRARARGVELCEGVAVLRVARGASHGWTLDVRAADGAAAESGPVEADFVVDAAGGRGGLAATLGLDDASATLATRSRSLFGHFEGVRRWADVYGSVGGDAGPHPFPADDAALHHVTPEGWVWMLRFDSGITSVGAMLHSAAAREQDAPTPLEQLPSLCGRYPSIAAQLADARPVRDVVATGFLQRRVRPAAGDGWALLPGAAYFVDALLSPGNAHTLTGVERLARAFESWPDRRALARGLDGYAASLDREIDLVDTLVHGCYAAFEAFELLTAFSMYYFAGAICSEERRERGEAAPSDGFLMAHDADFVGRVRAGYRRLLALTAAGRPDARDVEGFGEHVRGAIEPYNPAGLCDPAKLNLYPYA